ncbi:MAG: hypothetical protein ABW221_28105, partial [Vicinamibacteria bacterium]
MSLSRQISSLRKALCDTRAEQRVLRTVSKCGYRFVAAVEHLPRARSSGVARSLSARAGFVPPYALALSHLALGEDEDACVLLDR